MVMWSAASPRALTGRRLHSMGKGRSSPGPRMAVGRILDPDGPVPGNRRTTALADEVDGAGVFRWSEGLCHKPTRSTSGSPIAKGDEVSIPGGSDKVCSPPRGEGVSILGVGSKTVSPLSGAPGSGDRSDSLRPRRSADSHARGSRPGPGAFSRRVGDSMS